MFSLPRHWLLATWCGASALACGDAGSDDGSQQHAQARSGSGPARPGQLPEATPPGVEDNAAEAGGDEGEDSVGAESAGEGDLPAATPDLPSDLELSAPEDYGQIKPPLPLPTADELTVHAMAGYEVVTVYSRPDIAGGKLGYMRIGTRTMVSERVEGEGCKNGFYGVPAGGFACASKGLVVDRDKEPFAKYPPPAPRHDQGLPYDYGFVRRWNSPMWWRIPTEVELQAAAAQRAVREGERQALAALKAASAGKLPGDAAELSDGAPVGPPSLSQEQLLAMKLPVSPDTPWLERGFFLSLGDKVQEGGRSYLRTARGGYVAAGDVSRYEAKDFQGVALGEMTYPFGYTKKETKLLELTAENKLRAVKTIAKREFLDLEEEVEVSGTTYMRTTQGQLVRKEHLLIPELQPLPKGLEPWERWIDVSLSLQMLVAYDGALPVYVTLVSTGRKGSKEDPYDTPTGRWRINSKHVSTTMDGNSASDGNYSIQDVPWTMFFHGSYALHGAFWHRGFGAVRSHGCINLGPSDARWLFHWTTPFLPAGWHGVSATDDSPGSTVIVHP